MKIFKEALLLFALLSITQALPRFRRDYKLDDYELRNISDDDDYAYDDEFLPEEAENFDSYIKTLSDFDFKTFYDNTTPEYNAIQEPADLSAEVSAARPSASVQELNLVFLVFYMFYSMYIH